MHSVITCPGRCGCPVGVAAVARVGPVHGRADQNCSVLLALGVAPGRLGAAEVRVVEAPCVPVARCCWSSYARGRQVE